MTEPQPTPAGVTAWRDFLNRNQFLERHELRLIGVSTVAGHSVSLIFMSPYQSDEDQKAIRSELAANLPDGYAGKDVRLNLVRQNQPGLPPRIEAVIFQSPADTSTRFTEDTGGMTGYRQWQKWVASNSVLAEFSLVLTGTCSGEGTDEIDLYLQRDDGTTVDVDDLREQLPRIAARLEGTPFADGVAEITEAEFGDGPVIVLGLATVEAYARNHPPALTPKRRRTPWRPLIDRILTTAYRARYGLNAPIPPGYLSNLHRSAAAYAVAGAAALMLCAVFIGAVGVGTAILRGAADAAAWTRDLAAAQVVIRPVASWLDAHTAGMPVDGTAAVWLWAATGIITLLLGTLARSIGARIGWTLWGAATCWMTYRGTSIPSQLVAAGVAGIWWTIGSLFVFRRSAAAPRVVAYLPGITMEPDGHLTAWTASSARVRAYLDRASARPDTGDDPHAEPAHVEETDVDGHQVLVDTRINSNGFAITRTLGEETLVPQMPTDQERRAWEQTLTDAGLPGMRLRHMPDSLLAGDGLSLHCDLPVVPVGKRGVITLETVVAHLPNLEVLIGQRFSSLFPSGKASPGSISAEYAYDGHGALISTEVIITVFTGRILVPSSEALKPAILEIVTAAGDTGVEHEALQAALKARGFRTLTTSRLATVVLRMRHNVTGPNILNTGGRLVCERTR